MVNRVKVKYDSCHKEARKDSQNVLHRPIGRVELRWNKKDKSKSFDEIFYVVESPDLLIILGAPAIKKSKEESTGVPTHPLGVHEQTAGRRFHKLYYLFFLSCRNAMVLYHNLANTSSVNARGKESAGEKEERSTRAACKRKKRAGRNGGTNTPAKFPKIISAAPFLPCLIAYGDAAV